MILAGGQGKRIGNKEKALLKIKGKTTLEHLLGSLENVADEIVVSVRDDDQKKSLRPVFPDLRMVSDILKDVGPLAGILEGFKAARGEYTFVIGCDMPFPNPEVIVHLLGCAMGHDAALPVHEDGSMEPLFAVYHTDKLEPLILESLEEGKRFILAPAFKLDDVVKVSISDIKKIDPFLRSFVNINTLEDLRAVD